MNRLEKKCLMASAGFHTFLLLLLVFGSAFFTAKKDPPMRMINVIPSHLIDEALAGGGGNPNLPQTDDKIKGDTLKPVQPAPEPTPPTPEPPKPVVKETRPEPPKVEPKKVEPKKAEPPPKVVKQPVKEPVKPKVEEPPRPRIDPSELKPVNRKDTEKERAKAEAEAREAAARKAAQDRARAAAKLSAQLQKEFNSTLSGLKQGFNSGTKVDVGGPGGAAYANYKMFVQMAYENAWVVTPELTEEDFIALIKVTVARDGRIIASRISKPSGSSLMDRSVQRAMDRVRADGLPPFPAGAKDLERTFTIEFNLKARARAG